MAVPYSFATQTGSIPLSQLDSNFATAITLGNTAVVLGNTYSTIGNLTLSNVTISSGNVSINVSNVSTINTVNLVVTANATVGGNVTITGNVTVNVANVSTLNVVTLTVTGNETVGGNVTITGNVSVNVANVTTLNATSSTITGNETVGGNVTVTGNVSVNNATFSNSLTLSGGTANGVAYLNGSKVLTTGSALVFDGTNLGIGTSSPATKLHVFGSGANARVENSGATNSTQFTVKNTVGTVTLGLDSSTGGGFGVANAAVLWYDAAQPLVFGTNNTERMRIDSSGNVGIGVTANTTNIGGTYKLLSVGASGGSGIFMGQSDSTANNSTVAQFLGKTTGASGYQLVAGMNVSTDASSTTNAVGRLQFNTASGGTLNEAARIDSSGNLMVGTTSSNGKLTVDTGGSTGTTYGIIGLNGGGALANGQIATQSTTSVTNTATTILSVGNTGNLVAVTGQGSGAIFMDLLMCGYTSNAVTVISSSTQQGSPASRTYTLSSGALKLAMGTSTAMTVKALNIFVGA